MLPWTCDFRPNNLTSMSHLSPHELTRLHRVADEIFETLGARGHHIDGALDVDPAFRQGRSPQSALTRALVVAGLQRGASQAGLAYRSGPGGVKEVHTLSGNVEHIFRLRRALRGDDGEYVIEAKDNSMLKDLEASSLLIQDRWVFAYTYVDEGIDQIFVAPVLDVIEGNPGRLVLGAAIQLGKLPTPPVGGFQPADEDLEGFEDDAAEDDPGSLPDVG